MSDLNVAIVGCGRMGRERARCAQKLGATIVGVYDPDNARAAAVAEEFRSTALPGFDETIYSDIDAVFFCTPPNYREGQALAAIEARVPFLAEKPVGASNLTSLKVLDALRKSPMVNAIGYMNRYRASILHAKSLMGGRRLIGLAGNWVCKPYSVPWWPEERSSGGAINEQATHLFDLSRFLGGEITEVCALSELSSDVKKETRGSAVALQFASGGIGTIFYSCQASEKSIGLQLFTAEGSIQFSGWEFQMTANTIDGTLPGREAQDIFLTETAAFLNDVKVGYRSRIACDWGEAMKTQIIVDSVKQSMNEH